MPHILSVTVVPSRQGFHLRFNMRGAKGRGIVRPAGHFDTAAELRQGVKALQDAALSARESGNVGRV